MSVYVDVDNDGFYKKKVERLCICCSSRFDKYKIDVKVLKKFSEMAVDFRQHEFGKKCAINPPESCANPPKSCTNCTTVSRFIYLTKPFECLSCGLVFAHALHLRTHKESSEACNKNVL